VGAVEEVLGMEVKINLDSAILLKYLIDQMLIPIGHGLAVEEVEDILKQY
jgi:hypothetical protein